ncbi:4-alpha-glucanotransferase [Xaviernesmea oryzae]|uniref:4-alpha-glucanotransferase n=1 Tax=Xaviernesmea oryzae TaxID=464029 RepID=A0A1Q9AZS0_9HYPH|nr:4-alpha-glucanotransferase [Xaviernesmea oryzae]OLP61222.1 4-alpha-glucanotransferase [Xaviernesmea oryzae]SEL50882.1 4-alpha-glucanotransferase [Xaviernesmea oryzae]
MTADPLDTLARRHGILLTRPTPEGPEEPISQETKRLILDALQAGDRVSEKQAPAGSRGARKPAQAASGCYLPSFLDEATVWGLSLQLYELRSARNAGIGDFEDLRTVIDLAAGLGADFIGLNPLHAPFLADPDRSSPYEPSNRQFLNPLYIALDRVPGFEAHEALEKTLARLRESQLVDYAGVAAAKLERLRAIYSENGMDGASAERFEAFLLERGEPLRRHALFEAISADMARQGLDTGWHGWPEALRQPDSPAVEAFAREQAEAVRFHQWLQFLAHEQLQAAVEHARAAGLRIGLYLDLAVGEALDGSATWSEQQAYAATATIGSPPDPMALKGQDWHLAALLPAKIAVGPSSPYERMVAAAMRYAGAIRIDHAAALRRLFLVPIEASPEEGAYVLYPQEALLAILARRSHEHRCLVIGEDLGVLPDGLREDLMRARILSYRILSYERNDSGFIPPADYPRLALACISTHDHQTLDGWWRGADIRARKTFGIVSAKATKEHIATRVDERRDLAEVLEETGLAAPENPAVERLDDEATETLIVNAHRLIARTPALLAAVRLADLTREPKPTNIPGTSEDYPNWRPKLSVPVDALADLALLQKVGEAMREERAQGSQPAAPEGSSPATAD